MLRLFEQQHQAGKGKGRKKTAAGGGSADGHISSDEEVDSRYNDDDDEPNDDEEGDKSHGKKSKNGKGNDKIAITARASGGKGYRATPQVFDLAIVVAQMKKIVGITANLVKCLVFKANEGLDLFQIR